MNMTSIDVRTKLISEGLASSDPDADWFASVGTLPPVKRNVIGIYERPAAGPQGSMNVAKQAMEYDGVHLLIKGTTQTASWNKAKAIAQEMKTWVKIKISGTFYHLFKQDGNILQISQNTATDGFIWSVNFSVKRVGA